MHLYSFVLKFLQTFIENGLPGAILKKLSVYIFNLHWYAASRKLMMTWSFLSKFVFYQTSVKNCLIYFLQWNARKLIFSNSSSVHLPMMISVCIMVEKESDFSHQTNVPSNIIRTQSRWAQNIKPLKLVVAAYFICCILQLIHIENQWGIFISP